MYMYVYVICIYTFFIISFSSSLVINTHNHIDLLSCFQCIPMTDAS